MEICNKLLILLSIHVIAIPTVYTFANLLYTSCAKFEAKMLRPLKFLIAVKILALILNSCARLKTLVFETILVSNLHFNSFINLKSTSFHFIVYDFATF